MWLDSENDDLSFEDQDSEIIGAGETPDDEIISGDATSAAGWDETSLGDETIPGDETSPIGWDETIGDETIAGDETSPVEWDIDEIAPPPVSDQGEDDLGEDEGDYDEDDVTSPVYTSSYKETDASKKIRDLMLACKYSPAEYPKLQRTLESLNLRMKDYDTRFVNLLFFVQIMADVKPGAEVVDMVLQHWIGESEDTIEGVLLDLILDPHVPERVTRYICSTVNTVYPFQVILRYFDDLTEDRNSSMGLPSNVVRMPILEFYQKVKRCFNKLDDKGKLVGLTREEGRILFDTIKTEHGQLPIFYERQGMHRNNEDIEILYRAILNENPLKAAYPWWVSVEDGENGLTVLSTLGNGETVEPDVKPFIDNVESISVKGERLEGEEMIEKLNSVLTDFFKKELSQNKLPPLHKATRVHGPSNPREHDCSGAPGGKGPCRMLYCKCALDEDENEWFTRTCQKPECGNEIENISHALRVPLKGGGWAGCYCSVEHVYQSGYDVNEDMDTLRLTMPLESIGILDRAKI